MKEEIFVKGAKENNLKNIDVHIPRNTLTVFTGLSGSGKSTLAFDTIFAEGQRRYMESLSSYRLYIAAAFRLLAMPALTAVLFLPLGLSPLLYCVCVILAATPTAGATGIFSQRFGRDTGTAAQMVTLSTLLSILTLPVFAVIAQTLAGF